MPASTSVTAIPIVLVDGARPPTFDQLTVLKVSRTLSAAAHAHLRFDDAEAAAADLAVGKRLQIDAAGADGTPRPIFDGMIVSVGLDWDQGRNELAVDAYDKSYLLAQRSLTTSHRNKSIKAILSEVASGVGLTADVGSEVDELDYPHVQQWGTLHRFVTELCRAAGCEWWVAGGKLVVRRRSVAGSPAVTLSGDATLHRFAARFTSLEQAHSVTVRGWNSRDKHSITATATGINSGAPSSVPIITTTAPSESVASAWPTHVVSTQDATAIAQGIAERMGTAVLSARGEADVEPRIEPGVTIGIEHVNSKWNGTYYITTADHVFGRDQPFVTRFTAGVADETSLVDLLGRRDPTAAGFTGGLTIGIVTNNHDSEGKQNRVKLKLPYLSDVDETDWARIVQPGAGAGRGLLVLPEVDDEVLVGFEHGDIRRPYVLGGLWNGKDSPPLDTTSADLYDGDVKSRSFTSRKGHRITFVDGGDARADMIDVQLNGATARLLLGGEEIQLVHSGDFPLEVATSKGSFKIAAGGDITLKGKSITLDAQNDVVIKAMNVKTDAKMGIESAAKATIDIKASGKLAIDGGGMAEIKGGIVKIN